MKLSKICKTADNIIGESQRKVILKLIDMKVESEMKQLAKEIRTLYWVMGIGFTVMTIVISLAIALTR
ncbi:MAG: hypothetical protein IJR44_00595 [Neisseriaceae bacterium]|nr:hypothetical protein [Neisseriaceae bacterium]